MTTENTHNTAKTKAWINSTTTSERIATDTPCATPCAQGLPRTANAKIEKTTAQAAITAKSQRMVY